MLSQDSDISLSDVDLVAAIDQRERDLNLLLCYAANRNLAIQMRVTYGTPSKLLEQHFVAMPLDPVVPHVYFNIYTKILAKEGARDEDSDEVAEVITGEDIGGPEIPERPRAG